MQSLKSSGSINGGSSGQVISSHDAEVRSSMRKSIVDAHKEVNEALAIARRINNFKRKPIDAELKEAMQGAQSRPILITANKATPSDPVPYIPSVLPSNAPPLVVQPPQSVVVVAGANGDQKDNKHTPQTTNTTDGKMADGDNKTSAQPSSKVQLVTTPKISPPTIQPPSSENYQLLVDLDDRKSSPSNAEHQSLCQQLTRWFVHRDKRGHLSSYESELRRQIGTNVIVKDADFSWNYAWPVAFLGLSIHDLYYFNDQYGNTLSKVLLGSLFSNPQKFWHLNFNDQQTYTYHLGSELVSKPLYWVAAGVVIGAPLLNTAWQWLRHRYSYPLAASQVADLNAEQKNNFRNKFRKCVENKKWYDAIPWLVPLNFMPLDSPRHFLARAEFAIMHDARISMTQRENLLKTIINIVKHSNGIARFYALRTLANIAEGYQETGLLAELEKSHAAAQSIVRKKTVEYSKGNSKPKTDVNAHGAKDAKYPSVPLVNLSAGPVVGKTAEHCSITIASAQNGPDQKSSLEIKNEFDQQHILTQVLRGNGYQEGAAYKGGLASANSDGLVAFASEQLKKTSVKISPEAREECDKILKLFCNKYTDSLHNSFLAILKEFTGFDVIDTLDVVSKIVWYMSEDSSPVYLPRWDMVLYRTPEKLVVTIDDKKADSQRAVPANNDAIIPSQAEHKIRISSVLPMPIKTSQPLADTKEKREGIKQDMIGATGLVNVLQESKSELMIGKAVKNGNCFFDSLVQVLQGIADMPVQTIKSLRQICWEYAKADPQGNFKNWFQENTSEIDTYNDYLKRVQHSPDELEKPEHVIWGNDIRDGQIICMKLMINIHTINIQDDGTIEHRLITPTGIGDPKTNPISFTDQKTIHLAIYKKHFVPLVSNELYKKLYDQLSVIEAKNNELQKASDDQKYLSYSVRDLKAPQQSAVIIDDKKTDAPSAAIAINDEKTPLPNAHLFPQDRNFYVLPKFSDAAEIDEKYKNSYVYINNEDNPNRGYDFILISIGDDEKHKVEEVRQISKNHANAPVLIKQGDHYNIFGNTDGKTWKETKLDGAICRQFEDSFLRLGTSPVFVKHNDVYKPLYAEITAKGGHTPPRELYDVQQDGRCELVAIHNTAKTFRELRKKIMGDSPSKFLTHDEIKCLINEGRKFLMFSELPDDDALRDTYNNSYIFIKPIEAPEEMRKLYHVQHDGQYKQIAMNHSPEELEALWKIMNGDKKKFKDFSPDEIENIIKPLAIATLADIYKTHYIPLLAVAEAKFQQLTEQPAIALRDELFQKITLQAQKFLEEQAEYRVDKARVDNSGFSLRPLPRYLNVNHQLWSQGKNKSSVWHIVFWPLVLWQKFAQLHFLGILIQKSRTAYDYFMSQKLCRADEKIWSYRPQLADYDCSICPDWDVYFKDTYTSQGCLGGLLAQKRTPQEILDKVDITKTKLLLHPDFTVLDLSLQEIASWHDTDFAKLLTNIINSGITHLDTLNLSSPTYVEDWPADGKVAAIVNFLQKVKVKRFVMNNQGIGPAMATILLPAFKGNSYELVDLSNNALGDDVLKPFAADVASGIINIGDLRLGYNQITDYGVVQVTPCLQNPSLNSLDLSANLFGDIACANISATLPQSKLRRLVLDGNPLSGTCLNNLGIGATNTPSLKSLSTAACNLGDDEVSTFAPYLPQCALTRWDVSNNQFGDEGFANIVENMPGAPLSELYVGDNSVSDAGLSAAITYFPNSNITIFHMPGCEITPAGFSQFTQIIPNTTLVEFNAGRNGLGGNSCIGPFFQTLANTQNKMCRVDLSGNKMDDTDGVPMGQALPNIPLTHLIVADNPLTNTTAFTVADALFQGNSSLLIINFTGTQLGASGTQAIMYSFSSTSIKEAYFNNIPIDKIDAFKSFITRIPNMDQLGQPFLSKDLRRALAQANPANQLTTLGVAYDGLQNDSLKLACDVLPRTSIDIYNLNAAGNNPGTLNMFTCQTSAASSVKPWTYYVVNAASYFAIHQYFGSPTLRDVTTYLSNSMNRVAVTATATAQILVLPATENTASTSGTLLTPSVATSSRYSANLLLMGLSVLLLAYLFSKLFTPAVESVLGATQRFFAGTKRDDDAIRVVHQKPKQLPENSQAQLMDIKGMFKTPKPNSVGATAAANTAAGVYVNANNKF